MKAVYYRSIANAKLNDERPKTFPIKSGMRQGCPFSSLLFNIVTEYLAKAIWLEKEIKGIQIGKEEVKLCLFSYDVILHFKDPKDCTKNS
jgi:hypothetical protein